MGNSDAFTLDDAYSLTLKDESYDKNDGDSSQGRGTKMRKKNFTENLLMVN